MVQRCVKWKNIVAYGAADLFGNSCMAVIATWMLYFYTTFCGLSPIEAGSILGIVRISDAFTSPIIGYITDHFGNTWLGRKFGRRRFFILLGCPLMVLYILPWVTNMGYLYYLFTYLILDILSAVVMIPYETLAAEMTTDFDVRTKMTSSRMLFSAVATFLSVWLPARMFGIFGKDNPDAFLYNAIVLMGIFIVALLVTYFFTWDRPASEVKENQKSDTPIKYFINMFREMGSVFRVKSYVLHLIIYLFSFTARDMIGTVYVFFVVYAMQSDQITAANIMTLGAVVGIPCNLIWPKLISRMGPSRLLQVMYALMVGTVCLYGVLYVSPWAANVTMSINALYVLQVAWGVANSGTGYVPWTVYTFIPDVDEIITKQRREGLFAGVMTFSRKTTSALAPLITGIVLEETGFIKGAQVQTQSSLDYMVLYMVAATCVLIVVAFATTYFFKLTKENHEILIAEITRLKNGGEMEAVNEKTQAVVENLTGFKYKNLWGHNTVVGRSLD